MRPRGGCARSIEESRPQSTAAASRSSGSLATSSSSRPTALPTATSRRLRSSLWRREDDSTWRESPMQPLGNDRWRAHVLRRSRSAAGTMRWRLGRSAPVVAPRLRAPRRCRRHARRRAQSARSSSRTPRGARRPRRCGSWRPVGRARRARPATPPRCATSALDRALGPLAQRTPERRLLCTHARCRSWSTASGRASARGTSSSRDRRAPSPARTERSPTSNPACRTSPSSASTCSTCRRSTRSAARSARAANNALAAAPDDVGSPWAIGAREGGHTAIHPQLGTLEDFRRLVTRARASTASRSRSTSRSSARPTIPGCASTRSGSGTAPTAASSTPRTRRRSTRTSTRSTSSARTGAALWQELAERARVLGRAGRAHLPRRQPAHQGLPASGSGRSRECAPPPRGDLPLGGVHATEGDAPPRQARVQPVVHLLHLAQHQARADRILHRARHGPGREYFRPNVWPNTPDILPVRCSRAARAAFMARAALAATLAANYGIYGPAFELLEREPANRAARSTWTPRSIERPPLGPRRAPTPWPLHRGAEPGPP